MSSQSSFDLNKPFYSAENEQPLGQSPGRRWSISTLMAARPNPQHDTRATAARWNEQYKNIPQLQVNLARFSEKVQERSPEEIAENERWLLDLGNGIDRPNPRFSK